MQESRGSRREQGSRKQGEQEGAGGSRGAVSRGNRREQESRREQGEQEIRGSRRAGGQEITGSRRAGDQGEQGSGGVGEAGEQGSRGSRRAGEQGEQESSGAGEQGVAVNRGFKRDPLLLLLCVCCVPANPCCRYVWASLLPIVGGCSLSAMKEVSFSWGGFNNAMISNLGMVLRNIYSKKQLNDYKVRVVYEGVGVEGFRGLVRGLTPVGQSMGGSSPGRPVRRVCGA